MCRDYDERMERGPRRQHEGFGGQVFIQKKYGKDEVLCAWAGQKDTSG